MIDLRYAAELSGNERIRELEAENAELKNMIELQKLQITDLKEINDELKYQAEAHPYHSDDDYENKIYEQKMENEQQLMEFKMLASQINPHFLYNTLETIRMKALTEGNPEVANAIKLLGKSLRYVLENNGSNATTLKNELTHVEIYLIIQKLRFSERVNYEINVAEDVNADSVEILPLFLQPIVENAIVHGLEEAERFGLVQINVSQQDDELLFIEVKDNGMGMDEETLAALNRKLSMPNRRFTSSIGLYNIAQRIRLFYGDRYSMKVESKEGAGTKVTLTLPLRNLAD